MRDENRIREKIDLSLDNRQVVSLVIGSLVVLGVVFVLGVMVGKQLAPQGQAVPQDLLSTLDKAATDAGPVPLTFQQDLTKPITAPTVPAPSEARTAKPTERPATKVDTHPAEAKSELKPLEPKAEAKPEPKPVEAKAEPTPPAPKPEQPAEAPPPAMDKKLADAFSAAKKESASKPVAVAAPPPAAGAFTVQVAASQQKDEADAVVQKLRGSGLRPYLTDVEIPGKGHWYRVRLGSFKNKADAEKYVRDLKRETGLTAFVTAAK